MPERHAGVLDAWIRTVRGRDAFRERTEAEFRAQWLPFDPHLHPDVAEN
jgi:hypothetical protein